MTNHENSLDGIWAARGQKPWHLQVFPRASDLAGNLADQTHTGTQPSTDAVTSEESIGMAPLSQHPWGGKLDERTDLAVPVSMPAAPISGEVLFFQEVQNALLNGTDVPGVLLVTPTVEQGGVSTPIQTQN